MAAFDSVPETRNEPDDVTYPRTGVVLLKATADISAAGVAELGTEPNTVGEEDELTPVSVNWSIIVFPMRYELFLLNVPLDTVMVIASGVVLLFSL